MEIAEGRDEKEWREQYRNNRHLLENDRSRHYAGLEKAKKDVKTRQRFEAKPFALIYQEEIKKMKKEGKIHE